LQSAKAARRNGSLRCINSVIRRAEIAHTMLR